MTTVDRLRINIPANIDPQLREPLRFILRTLDGLRERTGGGNDKLSFITITQDVDLDTMESDITTLQGRDLVAGSGLTGGGDLSADRTFSVGAGTGISVAADAVSTNDSAIVHDNLSGFVANEHIDHSAVTLTAGNGLTGGGTIASSRSFAIDTSVVIDKSGISSYSFLNLSTDRAFDANAAAGSISSPPTQAEVENIRDAVLEIADVVGTLITDLGLT